MKICSRCNLLLRDKYFNRGQNYCVDCQHEYKSQYHIQNQAKLNSNSRLWRANEKVKTLEYYSQTSPPECMRCGFSDIRALTIDHIDGGGTRHTRSIGFGGNHFYTWLRKNNYPEGYQVLCRNCQSIKQHEKGEWANKWTRKENLAGKILP